MTDRTDHSTGREPMNENPPSFNVLAATLRRMYQQADRDEATTMIRLFGLRWADAISILEQSPKELTIAALGSERHNYAAEVRKGMKLARYASLNAEGLAASETA